MASGYGIKIPDLLLYGALGFVAYSLYKSLVKPVSQITDSAGDFGETIFSESGQTYKGFQDFIQSGLSSGQNTLSNMFASKPTNPLIPQPITQDSGQQAQAKINAMTYFSGSNKGSYNPKTSVYTNPAGFGYSVAPDLAPKLAQSITGQTGVKQTLPNAFKKNPFI